MKEFLRIVMVMGILLILNPGCSKKPTKSTKDQEQPPPSLTGKIVFVSNRTGTEELYSMNSNGTEVTRLTSNGSEFPDKWWSRISPDGRKITFSTACRSICVFDLVSKTTEVIIQFSDSFQNFPGLSWSQDSKRICFSAAKSSEGPKIWLIDTNSKALTQLTYTTYGGYDAYPSWSPKGDRISFWRQDGPYSYQLYVMNSSGAELHSIASDNNMGFSDWSPDTSKIAYDCYRADVDLDALVIINSDGTNRFELTYGIYPSFSPTGNQLVFYRPEESGKYQLYRMDTDGSNVVKLSTMEQYDDCDPDW